jgi:hypothetical protein
MAGQGVCAVVVWESGWGRTAGIPEVYGRRGDSGEKAGFGGRGIGAFLWGVVSGIIAKEKRRGK